MMTDEKFETLIRRLERYAKAQPRAYQVHVGVLAALGYVYLGVIILLLFGLIAVLVGGGVGLVVYVTTHPGSGYGALNALKLLIPLGFGLAALIGVVFRSFQVHFPTPEGYAVQRTQAPNLFAALDQICTTLKAPTLHHVLITDDFNAAIFQHPRLGLFGGYVNYLMLGLPLMEALSPAQYQSVLSHEMGHLSGNHSRFSGYVYRVEATWRQMLNALLAQQHGGVSLFLPFFRWYSPYFAAYSFVLCRGDEYVADRCAAQIAGAETAAQTLINVEIRGRAFQQEFWGKLLEQAKTQPRMPETLYTNLQAAFARPSGKEERWYEEALEERTGLDDTHPSLAERLAALGYRMVAGGPLDLPKPPLPLPPPVTETAAAFFLGPLVSQIVPPLNARWRENVADAWVKTNQEARKDQQKLDDLESKVADGTLSLDEAWQRASLVADLNGREEALPLVYEFLKASPDHVAANYLFGKTLLERKDARGLPYLKKAMAREPEALGPGSEAIYWYLRGQGRGREAAPYREKARNHEREWQAGQEERASVSLDDKFLYHGLSPEQLTGLRQQLGPIQQVWRVYLVRKQVRHYPEKPLCVLGVVPNGAHGPELTRWLMTQITLPGETFVVLLQGGGKRFEKPLSQMATAVIFSR